MKHNCLNCKYYDCYPVYSVYHDYNLPELNVCWKDVNTEKNDPVKHINNPEKEYDCFTPKDNK